MNLQDFGETVGILAGLSSAGAETPQQVGELRGGKRLAEVVALHFIAGMLAQEIFLSELLHQQADLLSHGITPVVREYGSLGCSGDLAPLSHCALALIGEGQ